VSGGVSGRASGGASGRAVPQVAENPPSTQMTCPVT
jgi:hypothetical protein